MGQDVRSSGGGTGDGGSGGGAGQRFCVGCVVYA